MACPRPHATYVVNAAYLAYETRGALRRASSRYSAVHYRQTPAARGSDNDARGRVTNEGVRVVLVGEFLGFGNPDSQISRTRDMSR